MGSRVGVPFERRRRSYPPELVIHYVLQLVANDVKLHHRVGAEYGSSKGQARVVGALLLSPVLSLGDDFHPLAGASELRQLSCLGIVLVGDVFGPVSCWSRDLHDVRLGGFGAFLLALRRRLARPLLALLGRRRVQGWRRGISFTFKVYITTSCFQLLIGLITCLGQPWYASVVDRRLCGGGWLCLLVMEQCLQVPAVAQRLNDFARRHVRCPYAHVLRMILVTASGSRRSLSTSISHFVIAISLYHILNISLDESRLYKNVLIEWEWECATRFSRIVDLWPGLRENVYKFRFLFLKRKTFSSIGIFFSSICTPSDRWKLRIWIFSAIFRWAEATVVNRFLIARNLPEERSFLRFFINPTHSSPTTMTDSLFSSHDFLFPSPASSNCFSWSASMRAEFYPNDSKRDC